MNTTTSHPPTASGTHLLEPPESLAAIAASLVLCPHPDDSRASSEVHSASTSPSLRITWCAFCGAMAIDDGKGHAWQASVAALLLSRARFEELSHLLRALHEALREGSAALPKPTATRLARDLDRLDAVLAKMQSDS